jgi:hypothetical protein
LELILWRDHSTLPFDIAEVELHHQVNFSEFGQPDVVIIAMDKQGQKHIVIVEVKLVHIKFPAGIIWKMVNSTTKLIAN